MVCASTFTLRSWWRLHSEVVLKQQPSHWVSVQKHSDNPQTNVSALLLVPLPPKEVKLLAGTLFGLFSAALFLGRSAALRIRSGSTFSFPFMVMSRFIQTESVNSTEKTKKLTAKFWQRPGRRDKRRMTPNIKGLSGPSSSRAQRPWRSR